jgi:asparagine synthase (glutamine-hydrolysing)
MDLYKSLLVNDYKFFLPEQMLYKVDRTSMANSLEVRSPFLDHNLIQYIMSHDISYVDKKNPKAILKNLLYTDFNSEFINRKKQGFVFDMESWIYNNKTVINETFRNGKIVGNYFTNPINKLSLYKSRINALRIWKLYTLENYFLGI